MSRSRLLLGFVSVILAAGAVLSGCSSQTTTSPQVGPTNTEPSAAVADEIPEGLTKLSESDRAAALKQRLCPVSGKELGSMGAPPRVSVDGRDVFLCCAGCEEELGKEPQKYLAKMNNE
jgi:hypothetical protein